MDWDNLYTGFKKFATRTADKINQTADIATLQVKLSMAEKEETAAYTALGRISYEHFTSDEDHAEAVAQAVSAVNDAKLTVLQRRTELERAKAKRDAEVERARAEREAARAQESAGAAAAAPASAKPATPITAQSNGTDGEEIFIEETE